MKQIINFLKKHKLHIACIILFIVWVGSCNKNKDIRTLSKANEKSHNIIDSLENTIIVLRQRNDSFPDIIRNEKLKIHIQYDNYISGKDRGRQLMDLHMLVKDNLNKLQK